MSESREARSPRAALWKIWGPVVLVVTAGFALAISRLEPPPPDHIRIAAGPVDGAYYAFASRYRDLMKEDRVTLEVLETAGSGENLELLARGEVDLALVQGGTASDAGEAELASLASLFFEPVWAFFRGDLGVTRLTDLEGRRVAVGAPGSGTHALALLLLAASGLDGENCEFLELSSAEATRDLADGTVDAAVFVASIEASYVGQLLRDEGLDLLSFRRHRAYSRYFPFLSRVILGEGILDLEGNLPSQDLSLLATAASLVARSDLHEGLIPLIVETLRKVHGPGAGLEPPGEFPSSLYVELPMAPDARLYLEQGPSFLHKILPFQVATKIDRTKILLLPFITLLIPLFRMAPPLYRWRIRSQIYRWYEDLRGIDDAVHGEASREEIRDLIARLHRLEQEVSDEVSVPLSYMAELYQLRVHIDLTLTKLRRLEADC